MQNRQTPKAGLVAQDNCALEQQSVEQIRQHIMQVKYKHSL
jgi:hypothetical protein